MLSAGDGSSANADDGHEAASDTAFLPIAEEEIAATGGTPIADKNVAGEQAGFQKLCAIGFAQIEENVFRRRLMARRRHSEPLQGIGLVAGTHFVKPFPGVWELRAKLRGDFRAHFVAAAADAWTNGSEQVRGVCAELHPYLADGFGDDASQRAAPARMNHSDRAIFGIDEKNRDAIRGLNSKEQARTIRDGGVSAARLGRRRFKELNDVRVNLLQGNELEVISAESGLKTAAIFENVFFGVPIGEAKIQDLLTAEVAHAARPSAESMDQPGNFRQRGSLKNAQTAGLAFGPTYRAGMRGPFTDDLATRFHSVRWHCGSTSIIGAGRRRAAGGVLIIGMGVDIAEVERIRRAIERHGETFLRRLFTPKEREYCERFKNKYERYAGRFAAKEAGMKALGTGWRRGVRWVDLEVVREKGGRPGLALAGEAAKIAKQLGVKHIALSITHTENQALAQVIFES